MFRVPITKERIQNRPRFKFTKSRINDQYCLSDNLWLIFAIPTGDNFYFVIETTLIDASSTMEAYKMSIEDNCERLGERELNLLNKEIVAGKVWLVFPEEILKFANSSNGKFRDGNLDLLRQKIIYDNRKQRMLAKTIVALGRDESVLDLSNCALVDDDLDFAIQFVGDVGRLVELNFSCNNLTGERLDVFSKLFTQNVKKILLNDNRFTDTFAKFFRKKIKSNRSALREVNLLDNKFTIAGLYWLHHNAKKNSNVLLSLETNRRTADIDTTFKGVLNDCDYSSSRRGLLLMIYLKLDELRKESVTNKSLLLRTEIELIEELYELVSFNGLVRVTGLIECITIIQRGNKFVDFARNNNSVEYHSFERFMGELTNFDANTKIFEFSSSPHPSSIAIPAKPNWIRINSGGSYGEIYKASIGGENLIIKESKSQQLQSLEHESKLMNRVPSKYLLPLYGRIKTGPQEHAIVVKSMDENLNDFLKRESHNLSCSARLKLAIKIAKGVLFLHDPKKDPVLHRDLKSPNILIDKFRNVKICDFGEAKQLNSSCPPTNNPHGTTNWMAPEVLDFIYVQHCDPSQFYNYTIPTEVYSFGGILCELFDLTGSYPYGKFIDDAVAKQIIYDGIRPTIDKTTPPEISAIIEQCWRSDPKDRFDNFGLIIAELESFKERAMALDEKQLYDLVVAGESVKAKKLLEIERVLPIYTDNDGFTVLHRAVERGMREVVETLLCEYDELALIKNNAGDTALHLLVRQPNFAGDLNNINILKLLLMHRPEIIYIENKLGNTPLLEAVFHEQFVAFVFLAEAGGDLWTTNLANSSLLSWRDAEGNALHYRVLTARIIMGVVIEKEWLAKQSRVLTLLKEADFDVALPAVQGAVASLADQRQNKVCKLITDGDFNLLSIFAEPLLQSNHFLKNRAYDLEEILTRGFFDLVKAKFDFRVLIYLQTRLVVEKKKIEEFGASQYFKGFKPLDLVGIILHELKLEKFQKEELLKEFDNYRLEMQRKYQVVDLTVTPDVRKNGNAIASAVEKNIGLVFKRRKLEFARDQDWKQRMSKILKSDPVAMDRFPLGDEAAYVRKRKYESFAKIIGTDDYLIFIMSREPTKDDCPQTCEIAVFLYKESGANGEWKYKIYHYEYAKNVLECKIIVSDSVKQALNNAIDGKQAFENGMYAFKRKEISLLQKTVLNNIEFLECIDCCLPQETSIMSIAQYGRKEAEINEHLLKYHEKRSRPNFISGELLVGEFPGGRIVLFEKQGEMQNNPGNALQLSSDQLIDQMKNDSSLQQIGFRLWERSGNSNKLALNPAHSVLPTNSDNFSNVLYLKDQQSGKEQLIELIDVLDDNSRILRELPGDVWEKLITDKITQRRDDIISLLFCVERSYPLELKRRIVASCIIDNDNEKMVLVLLNSPLLRICTADILFPRLLKVEAIHISFAQQELRDSIERFIDVIKKNPNYTREFLRESVTQNWIIGLWELTSLYKRAIFLVTEKRKELPGKVDPEKKILLEQCTKDATDIIDEIIELCKKQIKENSTRFISVLNFFNPIKGYSIKSFVYLLNRILTHAEEISKSKILLEEKNKKLEKAVAKIDAENIKLKTELTKKDEKLKEEQEKRKKAEEENERLKKELEEVKSKYSSIPSQQSEKEKMEVFEGDVRKGPSGQGLFGKN